MVSEFEKENIKNVICTCQFIQSIISVALIIVIHTEF
jgi:hypothetical protein